MGMVADNKSLLFALPEGVALVDWLERVLDDTLVDLKKINSNIIEVRTTLNERTGLKMRIQNADSKAELIKEQEIPKLITASEIQRIDDKITEVRREIFRIRNALNAKGYHVKLIGE